MVWFCDYEIWMKTDEDIAKQKDFFQTVYSSVNG